jgi:hypothetical protein
MTLYKKYILKSKLHLSDGVTSVFDQIVSKISEDMLVAARVDWVEDEDVGALYWYRYKMCR